MEVWFRNAILYGEPDSLCLLCKKSLPTTASIHSHLQDKLHRSKLLSSRPLDNFPGERIRKIKHIFYCEPCNVTLRSTIGVSIHISSQQHQLFKATPRKYHVGLSRCEFSRHGHEVLVLGTFFCENTWNGIVEDSCVICDFDVVDVKRHLQSDTHLMNLIGLDLHGCTNYHYIREIDDDVIHCLTCQKLVQVNSDGHSIWPKFDRAIGGLRSVGYKADKNNSETNNKAFDVDDSKEKNTSVIVEDKNSKSVMELKAKEVLTSEGESNMDKDLETIEYPNTFCADTSKNAHPAAPTINPQNSYSSSNQMRMSKLVQLFEVIDNQITQKERSSQRKKTFKHSTSKKLTTTIPYTPLLPKNPKSESKSRSISFRKFVRNGVEIRLLMKIVINNTILVDIFSFNCIEMIKPCCCICDEIPENTIEHMNDPRHIAKVWATRVVKTNSQFQEIVREIKPEVYHCGYCNEIWEGWSAMEKHLATRWHSTGRVGRESELMMCHLQDVQNHFMGLMPGQGPISGTGTPDTSLLKSHVWNALHAGE